MPTLRRVVPGFFLAFLFTSGLAAVPLAAQTIVVGYQQRIELRVAGATAAYSLNTLYADATLVDGVVVVQGNSPGMTNVVVVTGVGLLTYRISVPQPANVYPPGFGPPRAGRNFEEGSYEARYSSQPSQLINNLDFSSRQGDRLTRFHIVNSNYLTGETSGSPVGISSVFWELNTPKRDVTLLDQAVSNSPLTLDNVLVRGFHLREGHWYFHGGYTAQSLFQNLLLPTQKDTAVGVGYRFSLGAKNSLTPNLYYFDSAAGSLTAHSGAVGSLVFRREVKDRLKLLAETGWGRGFGAAVKLDYQRDAAEHIAGNLRYEPKSFSSVAVNDLHGLISDARWERRLSTRANSALSFTGSRYDLSQSQQVSVSGDWLLDYKLSRSWSANSGASYSRFSGIGSVGTLQSMSIPVGATFNASHFSAGALYRAAAISNQGGTGGGIRGNVSISAGAWHLSAYADRQTNVPTVASLVSSVPGLQELLDRMGISAATPQQVADLLHNETVLQQLGLVNNVTLNLSPVLLQSGATLNWSGSGPSRQQVFLNFLYSRNEMVSSIQQAFIYSATYSRTLSRTNSLFASASLFRNQNGGSAQLQPLVEVSLRHRFSRAPSLLMPGRRGTISGTVFEDSQLEGVFRPGMPPLPKVEVILDGSRRTMTDADGRYSFTRVPFGEHRIEARVKSERSFYFTTKSETAVEIDQAVNFGVVFSRARLIGQVENDAGLPIGGVAVTVSTGQRSYPAETDADGKFAVPNLPEGNCTVALKAESLPNGYAPEDLEPQPCELQAGSPTRVSFKVKALRSIGGTVKIFDPALGREVPVSGVVVRIAQTGATSKTDDEGRFLFRQVPPGKFTLTISYREQEFKREVTLPAAPTFSRGNDFNLGKR